MREGSRKSPLSGACLGRPPRKTPAGARARGGAPLTPEGARRLAACHAASASAPLALGCGPSAGRGFTRRFRLYPLVHPRGGPGDGYPMLASTHHVWVPALWGVGYAACQAGLGASGRAKTSLVSKYSNYHISTQSSQSPLSRTQRHVAGHTPPPPLSERSLPYSCVAYCNTASSRSQRMRGRLLEWHRCRRTMISLPPAEVAERTALISRPGLALFIGAARRVRNGFAVGEICSTGGCWDGSGVPGREDARAAPGPCLRSRSAAAASTLGDGEGDSATAAGCAAAAGGVATAGSRAAQAASGA